MCRDCALGVSESGRPDRVGPLDYSAKTCDRGDSGPRELGQHNGNRGLIEYGTF